MVMEDIKIALGTIIGFLLMIIFLALMQPSNLRGPASTADQLDQAYNPLGDPSA